MNWQLLFARDSRLWDGMVTVLGLFCLIMQYVTTPAEFGLTQVQYNWLQALAAALTLLGAKNSMSWVKMSHTIKAEQGGKK
jgi:hypothetical protein